MVVDKWKLFGGFDFEDSLSPTACAAAVRHCRTEGLVDLFATDLDICEALNDAPYFDIPKLPKGIRIGKFTPRSCRIFLAYVPPECADKLIERCDVYQQEDSPLLKRC